MFCNFIFNTVNGFTKLTFNMDTIKQNDHTLTLQSRLLGESTVGYHHRRFGSWTLPPMPAVLSLLVT
jgi:hypothetical protein